MIRMLGALVGASERAGELVGALEERLAEARTRADNLKKRPRVFFEEWDDPLISGIGWVSELVEIAGGVDIFANLRNQGAAKDRVVTAEEVVAREPDLIIGSWCGKKFRPERVAARPGFQQIPAVQHLDMYEIKSSLILQPGPAALTDGLAELQRIIEGWATLAPARMRRFIDWRGNASKDLALFSAPFRLAGQSTKTIVHPSRRRRWNQEYQACCGAGSSSTPT